LGKTNTQLDGEYEDLTENYPLISFGIIVLNGEPFVRYNLRAIYPFAHQIIVVEGAVESAASIATSDGHSRDDTLQTLFDFKKNEDPADKIVIVTKGGFWSEKDEMSRAYASLATGDYLWQIDIDEFYKRADILYVLEMLAKNPEITVIFFKQISFWGGFEYIADGWFLRQPQGQGPGIVPRVFKWGKGYSYVTHRQPTIFDEAGRDLKTLQCLDGEDLAQVGVYMYHYSLLFPKQVEEKSRYYSASPWAKQAREMQKWVQESYITLHKPFRVHNVYHYPSWLERFHDSHPEQINALRQDLHSGVLDMDLRSVEDIETLLVSSKYKIGKAVLEIFTPLALFFIRLWRVLK
jgi:hypothetical protein